MQGNAENAMNLSELEMISIVGWIHMVATRRNINVTYSACDEYSQLT